jgi:prepilin-type N-terminal cleavage/methylation domain-containing protein
VTIEPDAVFRDCRNARVYEREGQVLESSLEGQAGMKNTMRSSKDRITESRRSLEWILQRETMRRSNDTTTKRRTCRHAGFTLLELAVAVGLLSILSLISYSSISRTLTAWDEGAELSDQAQNARISTDLMVREIRQSSRATIEIDNANGWIRFAASNGGSAPVDGIWYLHSVSEIQRARETLPFSTNFPAQYEVIAEEVDQVTWLADTTGYVSIQLSTTGGISLRTGVHTANE